MLLWLRKQGVRKSDAYAGAADGVCGGGARDFLADSWRLGKMGRTHIRLAAASEDVLTGAVKDRTGDLAGAEELYRRALSINERSLGPEHPSVALNLNNLGMLLLNRDRMGEAEPLIRRALRIDEKILGPDHPRVATNLNNLATLLVRKEAYASAEPLLQRALAIDQKALEANHSMTQIVQQNLTDLMAAAHK